MRDWGCWFPVLWLGLESAKTENSSKKSCASSTLEMNLVPQLKNLFHLPLSLTLKMGVEEILGFLPLSWMAQSVPSCIPGWSLCSKGAYYSPDCPLTLKWLLQCVHTSVFLCEGVSLPNSSVAIEQCAVIAEGRFISSPCRSFPSPASYQSAKCECRHIFS